MVVGYDGGGGGWCRFCGVGSNDDKPSKVKLVWGCVRVVTIDIPPSDAIVVKIFRFFSDASPYKTQLKILVFIDCNNYSFTK